MQDVSSKEISGHEIQQKHPGEEENWFSMLSPPSPLSSASRASDEKEGPLDGEKGGGVTVEELGLSEEGGAHELRRRSSVSVLGTAQTWVSAHLKVNKEKDEINMYDIIYIYLIYMIYLIHMVYA